MTEAVTSSDASIAGPSPGAPIADDNMELHLKQLDNRISYVNQSLMSCQELTDEMLSILDSFEHRLSDLEVTMLPIHKQTQSLTRAQKNIDATLEEVDRVKQHFEQTNVDEELINEKQYRAGPDAFLAQCIAFNDASKFFQEHSNFQNAQKSLRLVNSRLKKSLEVLEIQFKKMLERESNVVEYKQGRELSDEFQLIPHYAVECLSLIARTISRCGGTRFVQRLVEVRSLILRDSLETCIVAGAEHKHSNEMPVVAPQRIAQKVKSALLGKKKQAAEYYQKGSHSFIATLHFFLALVKRERILCFSILEASEMEPTAFQKCFDAVLSDGVELLVREAEEVMRRKSDSRALYLLDILHALDTLAPKFAALISESTTSKLERIFALSAKVSESVRKAIEQRKEAIAQQASRSPPVDGGYDALTIQTLNFLKQLVEYGETMESARGAGSMRDTLITFLDCVGATLEQKAKAYKNVCLLYIFLVNNYHYVLKTLSNSELTDICDSKTRSEFQRRLGTARDNYKSSSWSKALSFIDEEHASVDVLEGLSGGVLSASARKAIKNKFAGFNTLFEELYITQKQISVPDADLRSQLRNANVERIVPVYHRFLSKFSRVEFSSHPGKYVKYHDNVLEQMLNKFFDEEA